MSNVSGINGSSGSYPVDGTSGAPFMSSEALLEYCQMQLSGLDGEVDNQMNVQKTQLREREAVESAEQVLDGFGTDGPQNAQDFQKCLDAIDKASASLPPGDPVAVQLQEYKQNLITKYQYKPATGASPQQMAEYHAGEAAVTKGFLSDPMAFLVGSVIVGADGPAVNGTLGKVPDKDSKEWQGDTDALANIADDVKSDAEIQMLQLQDLVSQRQQAVQLIGGMLTSEDQTLEEQAKRIGQ